MKNAVRRMPNWVIFVVFVSGVACAQNASLERNEWAKPNLAHRCYENEYEIATCLSRLRIEEESKMEGLRLKVRAALEEEQRKPFDDLDGQWKKYRQANCDFDSALAAGNSKSARFAGCMLTHAQFRVRVMTKYLACITTGEYGNGAGLFMFEFGLAGASN